MARSQLVLAAGLSLLIAITLPWWGAFFTGGCARVEWFEAVWKGDRLPVLENASAPIGVLLLLVGNAMAPLVEEFTFRGWLLQSWAKRIGLKWSLILTSFFFAIGHVNFHGGLLLDHFALGAIAAGAVITSGSLWPALAMHYAHNLANDLMHTQPIHGYFKGLFATRLFGCGESATIVSFSIILMVGLLLHAQRVKRASA